MLKQRVITASVMMLAFLGVLFFSPPQVFICFIAGIFLVGAWEWSDLSGLSSVSSKLLYVFVVAACGAALLLLTDFSSASTPMFYVLAVACVWWALAFVWVKMFPVSGALLERRWVRMLIGLLVLVPSWLSVAYLRSMDDGALVVLLCLLTVAAVDVGAYFSGRKFGRKKLAPAVSPGKSWEGVWGGLMFAAVVVAIFTAVLGDQNSLMAVFVILPAALISIVGDLLESMVKRVRGVKDSGVILPGHGGVLDRIDGVVSAVPVFALSVFVSQWSL